MSDLEEAWLGGVKQMVRSWVGAACGARTRQGAGGRPWAGVPACQRPTRRPAPLAPTYTRPPRASSHPEPGHGAAAGACHV